MPFIECLVFLLIWLPLGSFGLKIFIIKISYSIILTTSYLSCFLWFIMHKCWNGEDIVLKSVSYALFTSTRCLPGRQTYSGLWAQEEEESWRYDSHFFFAGLLHLPYLMMHIHTSSYCFVLLKSPQRCRFLTSSLWCKLHIFTPAKRVRCWMCLMSAETVTGPS